MGMGAGGMKRLTPILLALLVCVSPAQPMRHAAMRRAVIANPFPPELRVGLIAEYLYSTDGSDTSGNGRDLTAFGNATMTAGYYTGDGAGDYAQASSLPAVSALTISTWVNVNNVTQAMTLASEYTTVSNQRGWLVNFRGDVGGDPFQIAYSIDGSFIYSNLYNSSGAGWWSGAGTWLHVVAIIDPSNATLADRTKLYVNNEVAALSSGLPSGTSFYNSSAPLQIGGNSNAGFSLNGQLTDTYIYNRVLSASEINTLYNIRKDLH